MTRRLGSGSVIPVTLPAWIVQDGAERYPDHGDDVAYRLEFWPTDQLDGDSYVWASAHARPTGSPDFENRVHTILDFGPFTAVGYVDEPMTGEVEIGVELTVDYAITPRSDGLCVGTVVRRRYVTTTKADPDRVPTTESVKLSAGEKRGFIDTALTRIEVASDGTRTKHPPPSTWRRATALLLDIELT